MIKVKTKFQVNQISKSGSIAAFTLRELSKAVKPGVSTIDLDLLAKRLINARGGKPSFYGYRGYKYAICISVNDEVVHGIPSSKKIKSGDIVSIDVGVNLNGYFSDTALTVIVGRVDDKITKMVSATKDALMEAIKIVKPGVRVGELESRTGKTLKLARLSPIMDLSGHGVGLAVHEEPSIRSDGNKDSGEPLKEGMVLAIEPMATPGSGKVATADDGWTVKTVDGALAAHFEHTVAVTKTGFKILTVR